eukprot:356314-Chlamydomonas_euryale.AAC.5
MDPSSSRLSLAEGLAGSDSDPRAGSDSDSPVVSDSDPLAGSDSDPLAGSDSDRRAGSDSDSPAGSDSDPLACSDSDSPAGFVSDRRVGLVLPLCRYRYIHETCLHGTKGSRQGCTVRAYLGSPAYCTHEYAARRVQCVLYAWGLRRTVPAYCTQVKRCGCRRWCCGFHNTAFASRGVDFTHWAGRLRNRCMPRRTFSCRSIRA